MSSPGARFVWAALVFAAFPARPSPARAGRRRGGQAGYPERSAPAGELRLGQVALAGEPLVPRSRGREGDAEAVERSAHRDRDARLRPARGRTSPWRWRAQLPRGHDLWTGLPHQGPGPGERDRAAINTEGVLRQWPGARPAGGRRSPCAPGAHFLGVIVDVNPVSPRWWSRCAAGSRGPRARRIGPSDACSARSRAVRSIGTSDKILRFRRSRSCRDLAGSGRPTPRRAQLATTKKVLRSDRPRVAAAKTFVTSTPAYP